MSDTGTYVLKARLKTKPQQEYQLYKLLCLYCRIQNILISHAKSCIANLERDKSYCELTNHKMSDKDKKQVKILLRKYKVTKAELYAYTKLQNKLHKGTVNSAIVQKIAERVWQSVEAYLYKNGEALRFKKRRQYIGFSNKSVATGIRFKDNKIIINDDLQMPLSVRRNDVFFKNQLKEDRIKFFQIVRKYHKHKYRYYVLFYMEGISRNAYTKGNGTVGIDIGPSTIAWDSKTETNIQELGKGIVNIEHELRRLQRRRDRQNRANNPENFNADGTIRRNTKTFKKKWKRSKRMKHTDDRIKMLYSKRRNLLDLQHNILAKHLLSLGDIFIVEDMNWAALAKKAKETKKSEKTGRYQKKKRFGKSILNHAPAKLITLLNNKADMCGAKVVKVDCFKTAASQYDHTTGEFVKHDLNERKVTVGKDMIQRDLHAAFNLRHIIKKDNDEYIYDDYMMENNYLSFKVRHDLCMEDIKAQRKAGICIPASI